MAERVLMGVPSGPLAKAFPANVQQDVYRRLALTQQYPDLGPADGVYAVGQGGEEAPQRAFLIPYAEAAPGQAFLTRLYGWRSVADLGRPPVWLFYVLAEFLCVTGAIPGPVTGRDRRPGPLGFGLPLGPTENLCQSLARTWGVLGASGFVNSMPPGLLGSGPVDFQVPACAAVELQGSQLVSFDFAQPPSDGSVNRLAMNCLWAMA